MYVLSSKQRTLAIIAEDPISDEAWRQGDVGGEHVLDWATGNAITNVTDPTTASPHLPCSLLTH